MSNACAQHIRMCLSECVAVPPAGESWQTSETDLTGADINRLHAKGVIRVVERDGDDRVWKTKQAAWDAIQESRESLGLLACGHRPFSTVDLDSERPYSCLGEDCDARYSKAEIEAVIDGA